MHVITPKTKRNHKKNASQTIPFHLNNIFGDCSTPRRRRLCVYRHSSSHQICTYTNTCSEWWRDTCVNRSHNDIRSRLRLVRMLKTRYACIPSSQALLWHKVYTVSYTFDVCVVYCGMRRYGCFDTNKCLLCIIFRRSLHCVSDDSLDDARQSKSIVRKDWLSGLYWRTVHCASFYIHR